MERYDIDKLTPIEQGGTGATTAEQARNNLGLGNVAIENILPISKGGTGGNTFVKSASISGKTITLDMSDGTNKTLITQDTVGLEVTKFDTGADGYITFSNDFIIAWEHKTGGQYTNGVITKPIPFTTYLAIAADYVDGTNTPASQTWDYGATTNTTDKFYSTEGNTPAFSVLWIGKLV